MAVFKTGCIQLDLLSPSRIEAYVDLIKGCNSRYGHMCWHLIYQAGVRMRLEHTERIKRLGETAKAEADSRGKHHDFSPTDPMGVGVVSHSR